MSCSMDTKALNEALIAHIELAGDLDLNKTTISSDERGLFIEGKLNQIISIARAVVDIDDMTDESILNYYTICIDFDDRFISFIRKED